MTELEDGPWFDLYSSKPIEVVKFRVQDGDGIERQVVLEVPDWLEFSTSAERQQYLEEVERLTRKFISKTRMVDDNPHNN